MKTNNQIVKTEQALAKLERHLALEKIKQRKADTRHKIQLGGLIIKANMDNFSKDIILGALLYGKKSLETEPGTKELYQSLGRAEFNER